MHDSSFIIMIGVLRRLGEPRKKLQEGEEDKKQPQEVHVYGDRFEWTKEEYTKFLNQFNVPELRRRLEEIGYDGNQGKNKEGRVEFLASHYTKFETRVDAMMERFNAVGVAAKKIRKSMDGMDVVLGVLC